MNLPDSNWVHPPGPRRIITVASHSPEASKCDPGNPIHLPNLSAALDEPGDYRASVHAPSIFLPQMSKLQIFVSNSKVICPKVAMEKSSTMCMIGRHTLLAVVQAKPTHIYRTFSSQFRPPQFPLDMDLNSVPLDASCPRPSPVCLFF